MLDFNQIKNFYAATLRSIAIDLPTASELDTLNWLVERLAAIPEAGSKEKEFVREFTKIYTWDMVRGLRDISPRAEGDLMPKPEKLSPSALLERIREEKERAVFICFDLWVSVDSKSPRNQQYIRDFLLTAQSVRNQNKLWLLMGEGMDLPSYFDGSIAYMRKPLPDFAEMEKLFDKVVDEVIADVGDRIPNLLDEAGKTSVIRSLQGLTHEEANDAIMLGVRAYKRISEEFIPDITKLKVEKLRRRNVDFAPPADVPACGLEHLMDWMADTQQIFKPEAREWNIPYPNGVILVGPPGTGKSLVAKNLGKTWGFPVLSVNVSRMMDSLVGKSEKNFREVLAIADSIAPCILFMDELDKALAGMGNDNSTDSGTSQRMFGDFLMWLNDKTTPVFVVATANRPQGFRPELLRRFDAIFYVPLPDQKALEQIWSVQLSQFKFELKPSAIERLAKVSVGYSGAEVQKCCHRAATKAFARNNPGNTTVDELKKILEERPPQSQTEKDKAEIQQLEVWARSGGAIWASQEVQQSTSNGRKFREIEIAV